MLSPAQHQLLQLLKIQPLQLRSQFASQSDTTAVKPPELEYATVSEPQPYVPDLSDVICQDIMSLFQQTPVKSELSLQLGSLSWFIDHRATESLLTESQLITPPLSLLRQPAMKRQLWQQLSCYLDQL